MRNFFLFVFVLLISFSCKTDSKESREKPLIVATTSILADGIKNLVGDQADVIALMPAGVDPHLYKASVRDLDLLTNADLVVYHGLYLEGKMTEIFEKLALSQSLIDISQGLPKSELIRSGPEAHSVDPHIWFDVNLWSKAMAYVSQEMIEWKPEWQSILESNSAAYLDQLQELDAEVRLKVNELRSAGQILVTAHDAFAYFGKAYLLEVKSLQGLSTLSEPGLRDLTELIQLVQVNKVKAIFAEQTISPKAIRAVAAGAAENNHQVKLAGPLYTDSLDAVGTPAGTYIGMVKTNLKIIYENLLL
ncbi:metal ABC transporter solute-binding protein, Zn/Mn family [Algoriphagus sp.]|jgi:manganese/zinc/iron transport system substrate-binding protein|uniref:metal ABC transporter solute-binding protein, Zn/Mn family n=1 Tax=Algoriphagus sp. TaxID=1872435 RepID=UPI00271C9B94|nr:zinc ABC transporter substrate-binding protein [Algoriphagus sp.]MDO8965819.1 zinc ABC transporter substrate-binding protein [Algoriphagus sp.]MDP3198914.1 zinc ABC transporter substrate-binding protein [Algoriphagus sp.]